MLARVLPNWPYAIAALGLAVAASTVVDAPGIAGRWSWLVGALLMFPLVLALHRRRAAGVARGAAHGNGAEPADARALEAVAARQHAALWALAELDRAVLSSASTERVIQTLVKRAPPVVGCDVFAVTMLSTDVQPRVRTLVVRMGCGIVEHATNCSHASVISLLSEPEGRWLDDVHGHPLGACVAAHGANHVLLIPVFVDAELTAVISIGMVESGRLSQEQQQYASDFAARLGVALTASTHRENHYLEGHFDSLTGLPNRRSLTERLRTEISRAQRDDLRMALIFINLDEFKKVNDVAGYAGGDEVLREAAIRLKKCLRDQDVLARYGADEFLALLPTINAGINAGKVAEKLCAALTLPFVVAGEDYHLGASIGVSLYPEDGRDAPKLLHNADVAMSRAKTGGAGRTVFYEERINAEVAARAAMERDLRQAVSQNQLTVAYQPMIEISSGRVVGAEALMRWNHVQRGAVGPTEFIAIAEQSNLIEQMGEFMRGIVCRQYQTWVADGIAPSRISLNVSGREIGHPDFLERIDAVLRETGMRPFCLELEVTESLLVDSSSRALSTLEHLQSKGVRIAIDDFGTGYSSLAYLRHMPFDVLKIDRAFIRDIGENRESDSIVNAIVAIAHSLGKELVAEGVETEEQRLSLERKGVEVGQGFLWSSATSAEQYASYSRALAAPALLQAAG